MMLPHLTTAEPPVKDWWDACFSTRILVPEHGCSVMPCADCHRMLDLADMRYDPRAGTRRIVCRRCAS